MAYLSWEEILKVLCLSKVKEDSQSGCESLLSRYQQNLDSLDHSDTAIAKEDTISSSQTLELSKYLLIKRDAPNSPLTTELLQER